MLIVGYILVALFLVYFLNHNLLQSDVLGYWQDSLNWRTPFHSFHVPGYPLLIALLNGMTFNALHPLWLMELINLAAFTISLYLLNLVIRLLTNNETYAALGMLLFGLWPFVGLTYTVLPLADMPVLCLFLAGFYYLLRSKMLPAGIFFGLALITHKAIWIFVLLVIVFEMIRRKELFTKNIVVLITTTILPLALLWIFGAVYHQSAFWLISSNLNVEIASKGQLPVLDGILGTLLQGGMKGAVKGLIIIGFMAIGMAALILNLKSRIEFRYWGLAISLGILALFLILNQHEIWAAVRFSRLLVIPLAIGLPASAARLFTHKHSLAMIVTVLCLFFLSQFAYAWYVAQVFYA